MDNWGEWLETGRFGTEPSSAHAAREVLCDIRDRLLATLDTRASNVLIDLGCGDGLIGLQAILEMPLHGRIIFVEASEGALDLCRTNARRMRVEAQCQFVLGRAEDLSFLDSSTVDAVTCRAVLVYISDKFSVFREVRRVLRHGGSFVFCEPVNKTRSLYKQKFLEGYDMSAVSESYDRVNRYINEIKETRLTAMYDFSADDIIRMLDQAGFRDISVKTETRIFCGKPEWDQLMYASPNPMTPSLKEILRICLSHQKAKEFENVLRERWASSEVKRCLSLLFASSTK